MPNPDTPDDVAYYDFSAWPGLGGAPGRGGNAVFSGHVDSGRAACKNGTVAPPCEAVFWELRNLSTGDEIQIRISGETFNYRVVTRENVSAVDGAWDQIVASTAEETLTIITCGGEFDRRTGGIQSPNRGDRRTRLKPKTKEGKWRLPAFIARAPRIFVIPAALVTASLIALGIGLSLGGVDQASPSP